MWSKILCGHSTLSWVSYSWILTHSTNLTTLFKRVFPKWKIVSRFHCSDYFTVTCVKKQQFISQDMRLFTNNRHELRLTWEHITNFSKSSLKSVLISKDLRLIIYPFKKAFSVSPIIIRWYMTLPLFQPLFS